MEHVIALKDEPATVKLKRKPVKDLLTKATGRFYTHSLIAGHLASATVSHLAKKRSASLKIVEPFCGDGRLVCALLKAVSNSRVLRQKQFIIELWELDEATLEIAKQSVTKLANELDLKFSVVGRSWDTFANAQPFYDRFDVCLTNPPWDVLRPDNRELQHFNGKRQDYIEKLKNQDVFLTKNFSLSAPSKRYSGWGANLARCGVEVSLRLVKKGGICGVVSPSSLLADQTSDALRQWIFKSHRVFDLAHYAAEARLFPNVDQSCITLIANKRVDDRCPPRFSSYDKYHAKTEAVIALDEWEHLKKRGYIFPIQFGIGLIRLHSKLAHLPTFKDLEMSEGLWAGRELDETGYRNFVGLTGEHLFLKGRMVERFSLAETPKEFVAANGPKIPSSVKFTRIAWRDVSRPNQKRRIQATIIPANWVTGNSLHVAYFKDGKLPLLNALLGILNSVVFESQVRANLSTAHVSLGVVRQAHIPLLTNHTLVQHLAEIVTHCLEGNQASLVKLEVEVAKAYGLTREEFSQVLKSFPKLTHHEKEALMEASEWQSDEQVSPIEKPNRIPNHFSASLSPLDSQIVSAVPPGGNWKNIPESVPSNRLKQIRESYAAGGGSRSTYYGRLSPDAPSYTINTYFSRPGNGCHIHYKQERVLSQREAARLQSFPDAFVFSGNNGAINQQIGNAVPPLLAFQISRHLGTKGRFVDLFAGAGGLALGFIWAGWESVLANDISESFLQTYRENIGGKVIPGDIRDERVFKAIVREAKLGRKGKAPLFVLGGPPCQGFSTAGNRRSMEDERNWLFKQYRLILEEIKPDGFVFENVPGLLSMEGGRVYEMICRELSSTTSIFNKWKLQAERYAVPQRRTRLVLVGGHVFNRPLLAPPEVTEYPKNAMLFGNLPPAITVKQALSDLPPLFPGEDGSRKNYVTPPANSYQRFMRGEIQAEQFLDYVKSGGS